MAEHAPAFAPAKLRPPAIAFEPIARPELDAALRSIPEVALTLVTAPAGSGKTVGVASWAATAEVPVAWLRLEPSDHEPSRLLAAVLAAVAVARPELRTPTWPEPGPVSFEAWLTRRLLIPLAEHGGSLVLTLDEAEVEANGPLARMLEWLLDNRSPGLHLCVIGRELPVIPLARLEARGELLRIGVDQLWFEERDLKGPLYSLTRGWPVAVRLVMQSIREGRLISREPVDRRVLAYMIEEVVDRLAPELRELLIDTAILDELEPDACVAVSGRADAGERLWAARDVGLLLGGSAGLQVHPLLREALLQRARLEGRAWARHRLASRFYAARGRIEAALRHGVAGNDLEGLAKLARERGWTMLRAGQLEGLARLLAAVDEAGSIEQVQPEDRAVVAVLRAWSALREGPAAARIALGHARCHAERHELMQRSLAALEALVELRSGEVARGLALATAALDGLRVEQRGLAVVLRLAIAFAHELTHEWDGALEALAHAAQDAAITPALPSLATITAHRVRLLGRLARAREAAELAEVVGARLLELGLDQTPAAGALAIELAMIELARGRFAEAEQAALRALASVELGGDAAMHVRGLVGLARVRRALGDADGVAQALELAWARCQVAQSRHLAVLVAIEQRPLTPLDDRLGTLGPLGATLYTELRLGRASAWLREPNREAARLPALIDELEREREAADAEGRRLVSIQARVLLAALEPDRAAIHFQQAIAQAELEQLRGPFLVEREHLARLAESLPEWLADLRPSSTSSSPEPLLSERELDVLREIARGLSNQLIASTLHISLTTVKTHVHHILAKLEVRNRTEAVHRARSLGLIE